MTTRTSVNEDGTGGYFYGYYASFDATDCGPVDNVLDAVARACRAYHHTEYWRDPMDCEDEGPSYIDNIEAKSREAASAFASLTTRVEEQASRIEELEGALRDALDLVDKRRSRLLAGIVVTDLEGEDLETYNTCSRALHPRDEGGGA